MKESARNIVQGLLIVGGFIFICLIFVNMYFMGDTVKTFVNIASAQSISGENNVTFPFPNSANDVTLDSELEILRLYGLPIHEFHQRLTSNYVYSDVYDCKYWTLVWAQYWKYNKDKYNWKFETIDTDTHLFSMVYNDSMYCTMDQNNLNCMKVS